LEKESLAIIFGVKNFLISRLSRITSHCHVFSVRRDTNTGIITHPKMGSHPGSTWLHYQIQDKQMFG